MSAITLPMIAPKVAATTVAGDPVQAEKIESFVAFDKPYGRPDLALGKIKYQIVFTLSNEGTMPTKAVWEYTTGTARDADMVTLTAATTTVL